MTNFNESPTLIDPVKITDGYIDNEDWRVKENSSTTWSIGGLILHQSQTMTAQYYLEKLYPEEVRNAHKSCDFHIHDLGFLGGYCHGWSLRKILEEGITNIKGKISSGPAKHLIAAMQHIVNILGTFQNESAGANAFNSFDTLLAPFIKKDNMQEKEIKQAMQQFCYGINFPSRWGCFDTDTYIETAPFIEITLEDNSILKLYENQTILTKNKGIIFVKDLTENDEI